ncbi:MAG: M56 family metallopeptidase, partial [Phycisphaerales bacterium]
MEHYLTQITDYLLAQSWQIGVLVAIVAAVTLVLKNRSAHVRYLLWLIVLAKCLVPPLLAIPLPVLPAEKSAEPVPVPPTQIPMLIFDADYAAVPESSPLAPDTVSALTVPVGTEAPSSPAILQRLTTRQWLGFVWVAGVVALAVFATIKALRTNCWLKRQRKPLAAKLQTGIENQFAGLGFGPFPKVWLIEGMGQPFVWGLLRGNIYLPTGFARLNSAEHRRDVLGHELSHVLRFDAAVNLLQVIAQAVFWFHPFVWWANKRIRAEREKCCDEMAVACLGAKAKDYSTAIVNTLIAERKSTRPVPSLAVAGPVKNIEERIKTMMRPGKRFYKRPSVAAATVVLLLALLTVPTAFVLTARAERSNPVAEEPVDNGPEASKRELSTPKEPRPWGPEQATGAPDENVPAESQKISGVDSAVVLGRIGGKMRVTGLLGSARAELRSLQVGDIIETVDGKSIGTPSLIRQAVSKIAGSGTTPVRLTVRRPGRDSIEEISLSHDMTVIIESAAFRPPQSGNPVTRVLRTDNCREVAHRLRMLLSDVQDLTITANPDHSRLIICGLDTDIDQIERLIIKIRSSAVDQSSDVAGPIREHENRQIQPGGTKGKVLAFDDFEGKLGLTWDILRADKSHYSLSSKPGTLTITTQDGHFKGANADYENVFLIDTPASPDQDFQITTCLLAFRPLEAYNQAGLICWDDENNYLEWVYQKMNRRGLNFNAGVEANGPTRYTYIPADGSFEKLWLRVNKRGSSYECSASTDGKSFTVHAVETWGDGSPKRIGLFALNGSLTNPPEVDASFDFFEVSSALAAPARVQVQAPAGETGVFAVAGDAKKVFEGEYLHRSRGRDYVRTKLAKCVCVDGAILYSLKMGEAAHSFVTDKDGRPRQYKCDSYDFQFSEGKVTWEQQDSQGRRQFIRTLSKGAVPDFNSRPDPYLVQHALIRAYDIERCGQQTFTVFDIDNQGESLNEYGITLGMVGEADVTLPNGRFKARHFVQVQQTPSSTWYKKGPGSKTEYWVDDEGVILRIYRHREPYEVILTDYKQQPSAEAGTPRFAIPEANLQIPAEMKGCAENLEAIYVALKEYEEDKGRMPDWLSQLVPLRLGPQTLFCTRDSNRKSGYWPDPNMPCSYCYELNPTQLGSRPPLDKTMRHYKNQQRDFFGDVVPVVRCFHHGGAVLNLAWDGRLYTSGVMFEQLFTPGYRHNMLQAATKGEIGAVPTQVRAPEPVTKANVLAFDDFDGKLGLQWQIINPNPSNYSLAKKQGSLTITTKKGHFSKRNKKYENVFLIDSPATEGQDFQITTCISSFVPKALWNEAGILCWDDEDNYVKLVYEWAGRPAFTVGHEVEAKDRYSYYSAPSRIEKLWLRITKRGNSCQCATSTDGESFALRSSVSWKKDSPKRLGLFANNGSFWEGEVPDLDASFEFFEVTLATPERGLAAPTAGQAATYLNDLEAFFQEMDGTYPFFELKGIREDWEKTKKRLGQKVESCESDEEFLKIVTEAVLCLRDSHMWFRDAKAPIPQRPPRYYPGISFMPATNERVVVMSCPEGLNPDLTVGTVVITIDGKNARQYLEERARARWAEGGISGPQRARLSAYRIPLRSENKGEKHT